MPLRKDIIDIIITPISEQSIAVQYVVAALALHYIYTSMCICPCGCVLVSIYTPLCKQITFIFFTCFTYFYFFSKIVSTDKHDNKKSTVSFFLKYFTCNLTVP